MATFSFIQLIFGGAPGPFVEKLFENMFNSICQCPVSKTSAEESHLF